MNNFTCAKFRRKIFENHATSRAPLATDLLEPMVSREAGDMFEEVVLRFYGDLAETAAQLQKGQWLTAQCGHVS